MGDSTFSPSSLSGNREDRSPLISVCIPVYNGARYIGEAIKSVLNQTFQNFEIIVSDNCSTDETLTVVRSYSDPRIRLFQNETNIGAVANYNRVLSFARGKYAKLFCADDLLYPDCLMAQAKVLNDPQNESVVMVFCRRDIVGTDGKRIMTWGYPGRSGRRSGRDIMQKCVRYSSNLIGEPPCVLFRTGLVPMVGEFFGGQWYTDLHFFARMLLHGDGYVLSKPHCAFRLSEESTTLREVSIDMGNRKREFQEFIGLLRTDTRFQPFKIRYVDALVGLVMLPVTIWLRRVIYRFASR